MPRIPCTRAALSPQPGAALLRSIQSGDQSAEHDPRARAQDARVAELLFAHIVSPAQQHTDLLRCDQLGESRAPNDPRESAREGATTAVLWTALGACPLPCPHQEFHGLSAAWKRRAISSTIFTPLSSRTYPTGLAPPIPQIAVVHPMLYVHAVPTLSEHTSPCVRYGGPNCLALLAFGLRSPPRLVYPLPHFGLCCMSALRISSRAALVER